MKTTQKPIALGFGFRPTEPSALEPGWQRLRVQGLGFFVMGEGNYNRCVSIYVKFMYVIRKPIGLVI